MALALISPYGPRPRRSRRLVTLWIGTLVFVLLMTYLLTGVGSHAAAANNNNNNNRPATRASRNVAAVRGSNSNDNGGGGGGGSAAAADAAANVAKADAEAGTAEEHRRKERNKSPNMKVIP